MKASEIIFDEKGLVCNRKFLKEYCQTVSLWCFALILYEFSRILKILEAKCTGIRFLIDICRSCRRTIELTKNIEIQSWYYFVTTCMITTSFIHILIFLKFISPLKTQRWPRSKWLKVHQRYQPYLICQFSIKLTFLTPKMCLNCLEISLFFLFWI